LVKLRPIAILMALSILMLISAAETMSQPCPDPVIISLGYAYLEPCSLQRVSIPVFMENHCPVGGFSIRIQTTDPDWLAFTPGDSAAADTIGSRISGWEAFSFNVNSTTPYRITVTAIANMPGGNEGVHLPPGVGLLFTIHMNYNNYIVCDTSQLLNFSNSTVSDTTGYNLYDIEYIRDSVHILPGLCSGNPRGDANCSGTTNGIDVVYLVNFFKGAAKPPCCLCSGDVNANGSINGIDVTYLVNYLKGSLPEPPPCD